MFLDYQLPPHLIAQQPKPERDQSRLLVLHRGAATMDHRVFADLPDLLKPDDLLVLNNSKVVPARLLGRRKRTGGKWEGLFLHRSAEGLWQVICQTRGRLKEGEWISIDPGPLELELVSRLPDGQWLARPNTTDSWTNLLQQYGQVPLPPYIRKGIEGPGDRTRYQTVYAQAAGAVAAPTAGLHFTPQLLERLHDRGVRSAFVTLHVGLGTFQPIQTDNYVQHRMHSEWCDLGHETVEAINKCRLRRGRVIAVGTTTVRVLETVAARGGLQPWAGETDLFIYPPYPFRVVNAMITNFHLPRSTLLLMVGAFAGVDLIRQAYMTAIEHQYRFYSYGDAMLIV